MRGRKIAHVPLERRAIDADLLMLRRLGCGGKQKSAGNDGDCSRITLRVHRAVSDLMEHLRRS
jgi:hypothetical protein